MAKDEGQVRVKIGPKWRPPEGCNPLQFFKPKRKSALRHISLAEEPQGSPGDRIRLHINQPLSEKEKTRFNQLLHDEHGTDWYGCSCWGGKNGLTVRISIRRKANIADARMDVAKEADRVLIQIFNERER